MISEPYGANDVRASRNIRLSPEEFHAAACTKWQWIALSG